jgi:hypothetical protein
LVLAECAFRDGAFSLGLPTLENVRGAARPPKRDGAAVAADALAVGALERLHGLLWGEVCRAALVATMGAFSDSLARGGFDMPAPTGSGAPRGSQSAMSGPPLEAAEDALEHLRIADGCESE